MRPLGIITSWDAVKITLNKRLTKHTKKSYNKYTQALLSMDVIK